MPAVIVEQIIEDSSFWDTNPVVPKSAIAVNSSTMQVKIGDGIKHWDQLEVSGMLGFPSSGSNLIQGMAVSCADGDNVVIAAGEININGVAFKNPVPFSADMSAIIRTGEATPVDKAMYVYAVNNNGVMISRMSEMAPTMDAYGTVHPTFNEMDLNTPMYHPVEGLNWRYLGFLYVKPDGKIMPCLRSTPKIWESTPIQGTNQLTTPEVRVPLRDVMDFYPLVRGSSNNHHYVRCQECFSSSGSSYGYDRRTRDDGATFLWLANSWYYTGSGWISSGYVKTVIEWK